MLFMQKKLFLPKRTAALVLGVTVSALSHVRSEVLVDWGGTYVSPSTAAVFANTVPPPPGQTLSEDFRIITLGDQSYATVRGPNLWYNGTVANLTPTEGYTAPEGKSSTFYGGWSGSSGDSPAIPGGESGNDASLNSRTVFSAVGQPGGDAIFLSGNFPETQFRGLLVFDKADFLNGMNEEQVGFDENSTLSFSGFTGGWISTFHWVVQDGEEWFISEASFTAHDDFIFWGAPVSSTLTDPNSQLWASYTPILSDSAGPYLYNAAPEEGYENHVFTNIRSVGIYFDNYDFRMPVGGTSFANIGLQEFVVTGVVVVPEPATFALSGFALAGFALLKRRKA